MTPWTEARWAPLPATKWGTSEWNQGLWVQVSGFTLLTAGALISSEMDDSKLPQFCHSLFHSSDIESMS